MDEYPEVGKDKMRWGPLRVSSSFFHPLPLHAFTSVSLSPLDRQRSRVEPPTCTTEPPIQSVDLHHSKLAMLASFFETFFRFYISLNLQSSVCRALVRVCVFASNLFI